MNSRLGLMLMLYCGIALTGCAGWKNQMGTWKPGSAATMPSANGPLMGAPAPALNNFNAPPPPSSFGATSPNSVLGPIDGPQKLDLSSVPDTPAPTRTVASAKSSADVRPSKMYNLEKSSSSKPSASKSKSSTLTKLASAAGSSKPAARTVASKPSESAVKRLSSIASSKAEEAPALAVEKAPAPAAPVNELPAPSPAPVAAPPVPPAATAAAEEPVIDTTLLAQPVRKGASDEADEKKESKGPQSRALPEFKFFQGKDKPTIYPVSNPTATRPVELIQFS